MQKSNFALISALYDNANAGLYSDVYFPIIKYTIVSLFYDERLKKDYYTLLNIQDYIKEHFGIEIPSLVLQSAVKSLQQKESDKFNFVLYENGKQFQIKQAWDCSVNIQVDKLYGEFTNKREKLENEYLLYLKNENLEDDKKFIDFISDNTDDILGYFEGNDCNKVDEKYTTMAFFLDYLFKNNKELFSIANKLFWGSIIAGFLKRNPSEMGPLKSAEPHEYFLDTSLIMALLKLSTSEHEKYSLELLAIIKSSGGVARVHPMTLREVSNIILSVENFGCPKPNTEIASAYERYNLTKTKLLKIRTQTEQLLDRCGVSKLPMMTEYELKQAISEYQNKKDVIELQKVRDPFNQNNEDKFRDIHDIYMDDYIRGRKKTKKEKNISFVTLNKELIAFCRSRSNNRDSNLMHPGKIIIEQWMNNTKGSTLKTSALTEVLSRCLVLNNQNIRQKLAIVSKTYNEISEAFEPELYKEIMLALYKRSKGVLKCMDEAEIEIKAQNYEKAYAKIKQAEKEALAEKEQNKKNISVLQERLEQTQIEKENLYKHETQQKEKYENEIKTINKENQKHKKLLSLYKTLEEHKNSLKQKEETQQDEDQRLLGLISYKLFYFNIAVTFFLLVLFFACLFTLFTKNLMLISSLGVVLTILGIFLTHCKSILFDFKHYRQSYKEERYKYLKEHDNKYQKLSEEILELRTTINRTKENIQNIELSS